ncbi:unnamed protein product [Pleuronectes platessa]|uniref:Uncharacterized protein n=1 Tax=Pleuronectes platessa TaxID=8262 RepID=A0A9N7V231_PLEPL|nr:unnamed protein product [Pleuronectes platessa]
MRTQQRLAPNYCEAVGKPSGVPPDTGAERNKGLLNFGRENILLQAQESPPGGGKMFWECLGTPADFQAQPTQRPRTGTCSPVEHHRLSFQIHSGVTAVHPCRRDEAEFHSKSKRRIRPFARILGFNETFTGLPEIRTPRASNTAEVTRRFATSGFRLRPCATVFKRREQRLQLIVTV